MCLNESYNKVRVGNTFLIHFLLRIVRKKQILYHQRFYTDDINLSDESDSTMKNTDAFLVANKENSLEVNSEKI